MSQKIQRLRNSLQSGRTRIFPSGDAVASIPVLDRSLHRCNVVRLPDSTLQILNRLFVEKYKWQDGQSYRRVVEELLALEYSEEAASGSCNVERVCEPLQ